MAVTQNLGWSQLINRVCNANTIICSVSSTICGVSNSGYAAQLFYTLLSPPNIAHVSRGITPNYNMELHTMTQPTQTPVIPFTDNTASDTKPTTANNPMQHLPTTGMGRAKDILPFLPFSKTTLFEWSKDGRFVAPVKLSPTMTAWSYAAVHEWLNSHTSTTSEV